MLAIILYSVLPNPEYKLPVFAKSPKKKRKLEAPVGCK
jgi:hypothetical protein